MKHEANNADASSVKVIPDRAPLLVVNCALDDIAIPNGVPDAPLLVCIYYS